MRTRFSNPVVDARRVVSDERGFALPTALFMLLAAVAIVSVGVVATIQAQSGTVRDQRSKSALTSAEAGVGEALLRYNGGFATPASHPCLLPSGSLVGAAATQTDGWCAAVTGANGAGTYGYQVCPGWSDTTNTCNSQPTGTIAVVSTGTSSGVTRRVEVIAKSSSGQQVFLDAGVKTQNGISLDSNSEIHSSAATGGDIVLSGNAKQCGSASVGVGRHLILNNSATYWQTFENGVCSGQGDPSSVPQQDLVLPPVNQGDAADPNHNDNFRITRAVEGSSETPKDLISGNNSDVEWDPTTRQLNIDKPKTTLTLTGRTYSFCKLSLKQNTAIYIAADTDVNIYFDSPESCDKPPGTLPADDPTYGTTQLALASNTRISANGGTPSQVAIYFVGSASRPTQALMSSNTDANAACVQNFILYGPRTHIEMNSNSTYCGALAGQSLHMNSNARIQTGADSQNFTLPGTPPHYITSRFVECSAAPASPPDSGC
jgi:Tfp pilus assembly protein PilX